MPELHALYLQELEKLSHEKGQHYALETAARTMAAYYSGMSKGGMRLQGPSVFLPPENQPTISAIETDIDLK